MREGDEESKKESSSLVKTSTITSGNKKKGKSLRGEEANSISYTFTPHAPHVHTYLSDGQPFLCSNTEWLELFLLEHFDVAQHQLTHSKYLTRTGKTYRQ